jgi:hypothetical protein
MYRTTFQLQATPNKNCFQQPSKRAKTTEKKNSGFLRLCILVLRVHRPEQVRGGGGGAVSMRSDNWQK